MSSGCWYSYNTTSNDLPSLYGTFGNYIFRYLFSKTFRYFIFQYSVHLTLKTCESKISRNRVFQRQILPISFQKIQSPNIYMRRRSSLPNVPLGEIVGHGSAITPEHDLAFILRLVKLLADLTQTQSVSNSRYPHDGLAIYTPTLT